MLRAGLLQQRITIKKKVVSRGSGGGERISYVPRYEDVPAMVSPVKAHERFLAHRDLAVRTYRMKMHFMKGVKHDDIVVYNEEEYDIKGITEGGLNLRHEMELLCEIKEDASSD